MLHFTRGLVLSGLLCSVAWAADETVKASKPADATATENVPADKAKTSAMDKTVQELAAHVKKSVVVVTFRGRDGERQGLGAGFIIDPSGLIATNLHVIGEARPISVELHDGRKFDVTAIQATERSQDLAILKIDARELPALPLGNSDELQDGQPIVAIGNPVGLERSVVAGVLSGRRDIEGRAMLQIALPIERGNSGGPMLDMQGRVHGLLTLKSLKTENLGFAIPINALKPLLEKPNPIPMSRWLTIGVLDSDEWTVALGGRWRQRSGRILVSGTGGGFGGRALCLSAQAAPSVPYEVAVQVKYEPNDGAAGLVFHSDGGDRHYGFYPSAGGVRLSRFDGPVYDDWKVLREIRSPHLHKTGWNELKVRVEKERLLCYLNDELVIEATDSEYKSGRIGLCKFRQTEAEFKGFRVGETIASTNKPSPELADRVTKVVGELSSTATPVSATDHLLAEAPTSVKLLERQAAKLEQQAGRVRRLAAGLQLQQTLTEFEKLLSVKEDAKLDLLRAGLLISKLDNPELDIDSYVQEVERHARRAQADLPKEATEQERLAALNRYLFDEQGFYGSRTDYDNRSNSYLNEVLDDREGLPISLSVLYMEIARRMGLNVVGVGMPRHFLARHEPKTGDSQLIDVFERGKLLSKDEAKAKFESLSDGEWRESHLDTSPPRAILDRMLQNLFRTALAAEDLERMFRDLEGILLLNPDSARDHHYRALVCYQTQRWAQARADVEWLQSHDSELSQQAIEDLARALERDSPK